jgi:hypothetical protein
MKIHRLIPCLVLVIALYACVEDTIQLEDLSGDIVTEHTIVTPLVKMSLTFDDMAGDGFDSLLIQQGDTILLYLLDDISIHDTMRLTNSGRDLELDYLSLHHSIHNMFPVGIDLMLFLRDSVQQINLDTILFSGTPGTQFIESPPLDANGLTIEDEVEELHGEVEFSENDLDIMFHQATHVVIFLEVPPTDDFVKILRHYRLDLNFGIECRGRLFDALNNE